MLGNASMLIMPQSLTPSSEFAQSFLTVNGVLTLSGTFGANIGGQISKDFRYYSLLNINMCVYIY